MTVPYHSSTNSRSLRQRLRAGGMVIGSWVNSGSPIVAELMAANGFDFLCVDVEHSAVDLPQVQSLLQAIKSGRADCAPLVRLHGVDYALAKRYLDAGAEGVIAPLVRTRDEAELLVQACRYPPMGLRGLGFCRANTYGLRVEEEFRHANENILVVVQIEHIDAVRKIDSILGVPGIDGVFIGPYDLSASMGLAGQFDHPEYGRALAEILAGCRRHRVFSGLHVIIPDPEEVERRRAEGYQMVAYSLDITMINTVCQQGLARLHDA